MASTRRSTWLRRTAVAGAGLCLLASAAACSEGRSSASPPTTVHDHADDEHGPDEHKPELDPCTLVTEAEAEAVLGPIAERAEGTDPILGTTEDQRSCVLLLERNPKVGANIGFADFEAASKFDSFRELFSDRIEDVDGLGEHAIWLEEFRVLLVLDRPELVSVQMTDASEPDKAVLRQRAIDLAGIALNALG